MSTGCGRGRGYGLDNSPLRRPESDRSSSASSSPRGQPKGSPLHLPSSLNAEANAFIPKIDSSALNIEANEFVPKANLKESSVNEGDMLVELLEHTLSHLHQNPGDFEGILDFTAYELRKFLTDESQMTIACDVIFEWAVDTPNFSYTCARLIESLIPLVSNDQNGTLLQHMLKRCRLEYEEKDTLVQSKPERLCSFTILMAELYIRILIENRRLSKLRSGITDLITTLSDNVNGRDNIVKTIIQVVKMCGACLEEDFNQDSKSQHDMDALLAKLDKMSNTVSPQLQESLLKIHKLRKDNWGQSTSPTSTAAAADQTYAIVVDEPVFYDPFGKPITRQQAQQSYGDMVVNEFDDEVWSSGIDGCDYSAAAGDGLEYHNDGESFNGDDDDDLEMTDEMYADFERFQLHGHHN